MINFSSQKAKNQNTKPEHHSDRKQTGRMDNSTCWMPPWCDRPSETKNKIFPVNLNNVKNRILFYSPSVQLGLESELNIDFFEQKSFLGKGTYGLVILGVNKKSKLQYAIKKIDKSKLSNRPKMCQQLRLEVKIMYELDHPNIIKLYNHFESDDAIFLVMEYAPLGMLFEILRKRDKLTEKQMAFFVKGLVSALDYMHNHIPINVIHRDIKGENILIGKDGEIKLGDFGLCNYEENKRSTYCGTPEYIAPEQLQGKRYSIEVDIWAVGILMFELLTGETPFLQKNCDDKKNWQKSLAHNIKHVDPEFPDYYPELAKNLTKMLLQKDPEMRPNIQQVMDDPFWIANQISFKNKETIEASKFRRNRYLATLKINLKRFPHALQTGTDNKFNGYFQNDSTKLKDFLLTKEQAIKMLTKGSIINKRQKLKRKQQFVCGTDIGFLLSPMIDEYENYIENKNNKPNFLVKRQSDRNQEVPINNIKVLNEDNKIVPNQKHTENMKENLIQENKLAEINSQDEFYSSDDDVLKNDLQEKDKEIIELKNKLEKLEIEKQKNLEGAQDKFTLSDKSVGGKNLMQDQIRKSLQLNDALQKNFATLKDKNYDQATQLSSTNEYNNKLQREVDRLKVLEKELAKEKKEKSLLKQALFDKAQLENPELVLAKNLSTNTNLSKK